MSDMYDLRECVDILNEYLDRYGGNIHYYIRRGDYVRALDKKFTHGGYCLKTGVLEFFFEWHEENVTPWIMGYDESGRWPIHNVYDFLDFLTVIRGVVCDRELVSLPTVRALLGVDSFLRVYWRELGGAR